MENIEKMNTAKVTDAEILKALECCQEPHTSCKDMGCPFHKYCLEDINALTKHSLDLINRQKAEIEESSLKIETQANTIKILEAALEKRRAESKRLTDCMKANGELAKTVIKELKMAKFEARKEFAERLKEIVNGDINRIYAMGGIGGAVAPLCKFKDDIDCLLRNGE